MASIFSEQAKFSRWLEVELLAVEARVRLGEVPVEDLTEIKEKAAFDVARISEIEATRHHDVVALKTSARTSVPRAVISISG
jgi:adenylosuccinate lyase